MGAFAPPAAWNRPKAKPPAVDPAVREAPLKALLALGLEKLATAGCDDRCYAATTPGRPLCVLVPGGGSGPTDAGLWSTLDFAVAEPDAGAVCHYAARVLARGWSVCVAPPASGSAEDADTIDAAVKAARRAGDAPVVAVVAHSLGGAAAAAWLRRRDRSKPPYDPCAVALLDGTHRGRDPAGPCVNWCTSRKPLDDPNPRPWSRGAAPAWNCYAVRSAGTSDHKRVPFAAAGAVFAYLDARVDRALAKALGAAPPPPLAAAAAPPSPPRKACKPRRPAPARPTRKPPARGPRRAPRAPAAPARVADAVAAVRAAAADAAAAAVRDALAGVRAPGAAATPEVSEVPGTAATPEVSEVPGAAATPEVSEVPGAATPEVPDAAATPEEVRGAAPTPSTPRERKSRRQEEARRRWRSMLQGRRE